MARIAIANQKGGCGKSTSAINLCGCLAKNHEVLLVDADPQASVTAWRGMRPDQKPAFRVVSLAQPVLHEEVPALARKYEYVVVDCPPGGPSGADGITRSALLAVELVIVPIQPSAFDLWSTSNMAELIGKARTVNPELEGRVLISRKIVNTTLGKQAHEAATNYGLPVFDTEISQRIALAEAVLMGQTIGEYAASSAAAAEFEALAKEVEACLRK